MTPVKELFDLPQEYTTHRLITSVVVERPKKVDIVTLVWVSF